MDGAMQQQDPQQQKQKHRECELVEMDDQAIVRTIQYLSLPEKYNYYHPDDQATLMYEFFQQFGEIVSLRREYGETYPAVTVIEFKEASDAAKLIFKRQIKFYAGEIKIRPIGRYHQLMHYINVDNIIAPLLQPAEAESPKHILKSLNDDCFYEIFKKLPFLGLCSVANVCTRFNQIAKEVFVSSYRSEMIYSDQLRSIGFPRSIQAKQFLNNFGSSVISLSVNTGNNSDSNSILKMIDADCINLNELNISHFTVDTQTVIQIGSLLSRLKKLRIRFGSDSYSSVINLISKCPQLEVLNISYYSLIDLPLPNINFPKLVEFSLHASGSNVPSLNAFLALNSHLEKLDIRGDCINLTNIFKSIAQNIPKLHELRLKFLSINDDNLNADIKYLRLLKCLKLLEIHFPFDIEYNSLLSVMQELSSIGISIIMQLNCAYIVPNIVNSISKVKSITSLNIMSCQGFTDVFLIQLAENLPNLKMFQLYNSIDVELTACETIVAMLKQMLMHAHQLSRLEMDVFSTDRYLLDENDYNSILEIVENRENRIKLLIRIRKHINHQRSACKLVVLNKHPELLSIEKFYFFTEPINHSLGIIF